MATKKVNKAPAEPVVELSPLDQVLALPVEVIDLEQGTPEWLELRTQGRPASETACIMAISPYDKPYDVWERKTGVTKKKFEHPGMKRGKNFEQDVRDHYAAKTGIELVPIVLRRGKYIASLDGQDMFGKRIGEIKITTTSTPLYQHVRNGVIPDYYLMQCQHQLMVTGAEICDFYVYVEQKDSNGRSVFVEEILIEVKPDRSIWAKIVDTWDAFWVFVDTLTAPDKGEVDHLDDKELLAIEAAYVELLDQEVRLKEKIEEQRLKLVAGTEGLGKHILALGTITNGYRKGNVDYKAIPELKGVNTELYRKAPSKTTTYRRKGEGDAEAAE